MKVQLDKRISLLLALGLGVILLQSCGKREVTTVSDEAYAHYERGMELMNKLYYEEALPHFMLAIEADTAFAMAYMMLRRIYTRSMDSENADRMLSQAYSLREGITEKERLDIEIEYKLLKGSGWDDVDSLLQVLNDKYGHTISPHLYNAGRALKVDDVVTAIAEYEKVIQIDSDFVLAYNMLGYLYAARENFDKAFSNLKKYVEKAPDEANPHDSLGEILLKMGKYDEAIEELNEAIALKPDMETNPSWLGSAVYEHLGDAYFGKGKFTEAIANFRKARKNGPADDQINVNAILNEYLVMLFSREIGAGELDKLEGLRVLNLNPYTSVYPHFVRGIYFITVDDLPSALGELDAMSTGVEQLVEKNIDAKDRYSHILDGLRGEIFLAQENYEGAARIYGKLRAAGRVKDSPYYRWRTAQAFRLNKETERAVEICNQGLRTNPNSFLLRSELARVYFGERKYEEALVETKKFFEIMAEADEGIPLVKEMEKLREAIEIVR